MENNRKRKLAANEVARRAKPRVRKVQENTKKGTYYHGDGSEGLDMDPINFEKAKDILVLKWVFFLFIR